MARLSSVPTLLRYEIHRRNGRVNKGTSPIHVLFLFVDHFELVGKKPRLSEWMSKYPPLSSKHKDADGIHPKHTWFYALDHLREYELEQIRDLAVSGFGEVELHWHHSFDNENSFVKKLTDGLRAFQKYGFMCPVEPDLIGCFAFIHGNWSLDNSLGDQYCGVDNEIELLKKAGCYADFTFPALYSSSQPRMVNKIYYATEDGKPKSYDRGRPARVGVPEKDDELMIFEGPLAVNWRDWRFGWHPTIENAEIGQSSSHADPKRIDCWVRQAIHVEGRPEWVFVKAFCHGGQDYEPVLGRASDDMFTYLEHRYNDGVKYKLHYVTAREAYNIVKAAEDGKMGDPNDYRNYKIKRGTM